VPVSLNVRLCIASFRVGLFLYWMSAEAIPKQDRLGLTSGLEACVKLHSLSFANLPRFA
jgi:hypothetical protein